MKKSYTLVAIFAALVFCSAQAQQGGYRGSFTPVAAGPLSETGSFLPAVATQTLMPTAFSLPCAAQKWYYYFDYATPIDTGYLFGNNKYGESECSQLYKSVSGNVSQVLVRYGHKAGTTGVTTAKIYSINPATQAPQTVLGTSATVTTGSITTNGYTAYTFSSPVPVTNGFHAAIKLPATAGDTVVLLVDSLGCFASADSLGWEKYGSTWWSIPHNYGAAYNGDIFILAVADVTLGMNEYSNKGLSLLGTYPNPAGDFTNIRYRLEQASSVSIRVFDLEGRIIYESVANLLPGEYTAEVDLKNIPSGNYYYSVKTNVSILTSRFSVVR